MKKNISIIVIVLILVALVYAGTSRSTTENSITIGAVIPQTGFGAYWGNPVLKGIQLAQTDLSSKFKNKEIKIVIEDSQSDPKVAVTAAQKLLNVNKADALYSEFSGMSAAISPVAQKAGKVFVYSTFNQKIAENNPTSLKTFISYDVACNAFGTYLNDSSKKVLIVSAIGDAAPYCVNGLAKHMNKENIKVVEGFTGTDFRTLLLQNKEFAPDYILPIMYEDGFYALFKQKHELAMDDISIYCYAQDCVTDKIIKGLPKAATEGMLYFETPISEAFIARVKQAYPDMTKNDIAGAANAYQSMMAVGEGLAACADKSATCVTAALANKKDLSNPGYKNAFFQDRILNSELSLGVVRDGRAGLVR